MQFIDKSFDHWKLYESLTNLRSFGHALRLGQEIHLKQLVFIV